MQNRQNNNKYLHQFDNTCIASNHIQPKTLLTLQTQWAEKPATRTQKTIDSDVSIDVYHFHYGLIINWTQGVSMYVQSFVKLFVLSMIMPVSAALKTTFSISTDKINSFNNNCESSLLMLDSAHIWIIHSDAQPLYCINKPSNSPKDVTLLSFNVLRMSTREPELHVCVTSFKHSSLTSMWHHHRAQNESHMTIKGRTGWTKHGIEWKCLRLRKSILF